MVLPSKLKRRAPGVHQQGTPGATTEVGLGVSPPAHQARLGVLTDALAHLVKKGLTAAAVIANFHWQRGDPSHGEGPADIQAHPRDPGFGLEDGGRTTFPHHRRPEGEVRGGRVPHDLEDLWRIKMRPELGYISLVSFDSEFIVSCAVPFPTP